MFIEGENGTITDGSGDCNYKKSTVCFSHIQPGDKRM